MKIESTMVGKHYFLGINSRQIRWKRLAAKMVDLAIVFVFCYFYPLGVLGALAYLVYSDAMRKGQSFGKSLFKLKVVDRETGVPCNLYGSFIRNLPFIIPVFFFIIPFWGWAFAFISGIPLWLLETYLMLALDSGIRLGDVMGDTCVVSLNQENYRAPRKSWFS